ncbi:MAG TPA: MFS transporter [Thermodesulfobacteriota bacterium]|nr:MFS transporter [Thermodesulfobacteriota bacterium]
MNHSPSSAGLGLIFRALSHRNYRLFFGGQSISLIGTWLQLTAVSWLVFRLTHSSFLLGVVGFTSRIPTFLFASLAGVLVDRWNRHRLLVATQVFSMIQALILAVLVLTDTVAVWHIIALTLFLGLVNAFDVPVRQSFVVEMIERREDLGNAIALNSSMVNGARLVGPAVAGILIAMMGEGLCFLLNALSFVAVIAALLAMRITPKAREGRKTPLWRGLTEGYRYAFGFAPIRSLLLLLALVSFMGMPFAVLMPVFAGKILHGGPQTLGFLLGATGVGALAGTMFLASRRSVLGLGQIIVIASSLFGMGLIGFSFSRLFVLSVILMVVTGFGMMVQMTSTNTVLQTIVDEDKRGRVMSFYTMAFMGMVPFGSLFAGSLASVIGAPETTIIGGISCLLGSLLFAKKLPAIRKMVRPIYMEKGIISEDSRPTTPPKREG